MPDRDVASIKDLIYYQNAKIIAKSAFAASDEVQGLYSFYRLKLRGDKKIHDAIPPLPGCFSVAKPFLWVGR
jgi:hypothetical protein